MTLASPFLCAAAIFGLTASTTGLAQHAVPSAVLPSIATASEFSTSENAGSAASTAVALTPTASDPRPLTGRWLDLKNLSHSQRYRNAYTQGDLHLFEDGQQRSVIEGRIKLDAQERYTIGFRASSGHYFNWAYADYAGLGFSRRVQNFPAVVASYTPAELAERTASESR